MAYELLQRAEQGLNDAILKVQQDVAQIAKGLPTPIETSAGFADYERSQSEANAWARRVNNAWQRTGLERAKLLEDAYKCLAERYGKSIFPNPEATEESIRQGIYFAEHHEFLDEQYWVDADIFNR